MTLGYPTALTARFGAKATIRGVPYAVVLMTGASARPYDWVFPLEYAEAGERAGTCVIVERWIK